MVTDFKNIDLNNFEFGSSQVWGNIRILPVLSNNYSNNLRLQMRKYNENIQIVNVDKNLSYFSYIPHAFIIKYDKEGSSYSTKGTKVTSKDGKVYGNKDFSIRYNEKMFKKESKQTFRFLPFHTAMEGYLEISFNQPRTHWEEYRGKALAFGLAFRYEYNYSGRLLPDLEDALRLFEIYENQVGSILYINDFPASVFIVSHPEDYRILHNTLILDQYSELIYYYGVMANQVSPFNFKINENNVNSIDTLKREFYKSLNQITEFEKSVANHLISYETDFKKLNDFGEYSFGRFISSLEENKSAFIGESIIDKNNNIQYMKTFHLSVEQTRKARLLKNLEKNDWNITNTAKEMKISYEELIKLMERLGFAYLLKPEIIDKVNKKLKG